MQRFVFYAPDPPAPPTPPTVPTPSPTPPPAPPPAAPPAVPPAAPPAAPAAGTPPAAPPVTPPAAPPAAAPAAPAAPATYELRIPAGSTLDQSDVEAVSAMARGQNWTTEQAQAALDQAAAQVNAQRARYRQELEAHPTLGGANLAQVTADGIRALDWAMPANTPEGQAIRYFLNKEGLGDHPLVVQLLSRFGKGMGEDRPRFGAGAPPPAEIQPTADVLFPSSKPK